MNINNFGVIKSLITGLESSQIEFKETTGQLERGMETICAFLNGEGGTVLFGVTDKGKVIGQDIADNTKRNIAEAINRLEPLAEVQLSYVAIPGFILNWHYIDTFVGNSVKIGDRWFPIGRAYRPRLPQVLHFPELPRQNSKQEL